MALSGKDSKKIVLIAIGFVAVVCITFLIMVGLKGDEESDDNRSSSVAEELPGAADGFTLYYQEGPEIFFSDDYSVQNGQTKDEVVDRILFAYPAQNLRIYVLGHEERLSDNGNYTDRIDIKISCVNDEYGTSFDDYEGLMTSQNGTVWFPTGSIRTAERTCDFAGVNNTCWKTQIDGYSANSIKDLFDDNKKAACYIKLKNMDSFSVNEETYWQANDYDMSASSERAIADCVIEQNGQVLELSDLKGQINCDMSGGGTYLSLYYGEIYIASEEFLSEGQGDNQFVSISGSEFESAKSTTPRSASATVQSDTMQPDALKSETSKSDAIQSDTHKTDSSQIEGKFDDSVYSAQQDNANHPNWQSKGAMSPASEMPDNYYELSGEYYSEDSQVDICLFSDMSNNPCGYISTYDFFLDNNGYHDITYAGYDYDELADVFYFNDNPEIQLLFCVKYGNGTIVPVYTGDELVDYLKDHCNYFILMMDGKSLGTFTQRKAWIS